MTSKRLPELSSELSRRAESVVVGGGPLAEQLLLGVLADGHVLLEGVPGTGKTLLGHCFSRLLGLEFRRIQLTPDLLPADITGTLVLPGAGGEPVFRPGPVFAGVLMADEVNRAPPRTQAALLEAMEERQVTVDGTTHALPPHFTMVATLNTVETEGAWPLPEAQLDRFLLGLTLGYPSAELESQLLKAFAEGRDPRGNALAQLEPLLDPATLSELKRAVGLVKLNEAVRSFLLRLVAAIRQDPRVALGPSPRATLQLAQACRARAAMKGRDYALPDDVALLLRPVLAHRVLLHPEALLESEDVVQVLEDARDQVEVPR